MGILTKKLKTVKAELMVVSVALFVLGVFLLLFPEISQEILCKAIGVALCVWGVLRLITYFRIAGKEILGSYGLVQGISLIVFGFYFVLKPESIAAFLGTVMAVIIIIDGILKLQYAVDFYHLESGKWWTQLIAAVLMIVLGVVALVNPFKATKTLIMFMGVAFIIEGIWDFVTLIIMGIIAKQVGKTFQEARNQMGSSDDY